jgi:hypothetical protein
MIDIFSHYNHEHRHSGIGPHTPYSVHIGTAPAIQDKRQAVLNAACSYGGLGGGHPDFNPHAVFGKPS